MRIAIWYHCVISGPRIPSTDNAIAILTDQMWALKESGLSDAADELHIGFNGTDSEALTLCGLIPDKCLLHMNNSGQTELATMSRLQNWLTPGWAVLYHHMKAVQYPLNDVRHDWRRRMEFICVWSWQSCLAALKRGFDTCGGHWYTPMPNQKYWPGNFWWATSDYLMTLPKLDQDQHDRRYEAEVWIGKGSKHPKVQDFQPGMKLF
jgi:hypothetical protein